MQGLRSHGTGEWTMTEVDAATVDQQLSCMVNARPEEPWCRRVHNDRSGCSNSGSATELHVPEEPWCKRVEANRNGCSNSRSATEMHGKVVANSRSATGDWKSGTATVYQQQESGNRQKWMQQQ
eukprot:4229185-Lingulodinium_polyedra.AAC.1